MQGFTIENEGFRTYLVYRLQDGEKTDVFGRGMLMANHIDGIIPVMSDSGSAEEIRYDITDMTELEAFLCEGVGKERQLGIFNDVLHFILGAEQYLLDSSMFVMNIKRLYIDRSTKEVRLIYLPVIRPKPKPKINERIMVLFRDILFATKYLPGEDNGYLAELINSMAGAAEFSPSEFFRTLKRLKKPGHPVKSDMDLKEPDSDNKVLDEYTGEDESELPYVYSESSEGNSLYSDNADSKKDSVFGHLKKIFFSKSEEKNSDENNYEDYYNNYKVPEMSVAEDMKNNYYCEEASIKDEQIGELSYIIRRSSGEKIIIDREVFAIGKAASGNNYKITDNVAVSANHAKISIKNGKFYVTDENSLNYTYVNGKKLAANKPEEIISGDTLCFADEEFTFYSA